MPTFADENLFCTGPTRFEVGGLSLRFADHVAPGIDGTRLVPQGVTPRLITQTGTLLADSTQGMQYQLDAIETLIDGEPHTLVDDQNRKFPNTVLTDFKPGPLTRAGRRYRLDYTVEYLQLGG